MDLPQSYPEYSTEAGVSTNPPQLQPPHHQKYAPLLPNRDFAVSKTPGQTVVVKREAPMDYFGVPVYIAEDIKTQVTQIYRQGASIPQTGATMIPTNSPGIMLAGSFDGLKAKYPTKESVSKKRMAIVGRIPYAYIHGSSYLILPREIAAYLNTSRGEIIFSLKDDNTVPMLSQPPRVKENMNVSPENNLYAIPIILLIVGLIYMCRRE